MVLTLYSVSDGPPSLAVRMGLKLFNLNYNLVEVDFASGEHLKQDYAKKNPQKEIPTLDDDGFLLSESVAILQYLADRYGVQHHNVYPTDPKKRAVINQRLAFNIASYYKNIAEYVMAPIFFDYERSPVGLKKVKAVLDVFNNILQNEGKLYAAGVIYITLAFYLFTG
uniref:GST N-terminal domain-containing protein n=1 Tax=Clastoptera arizonana TaxID=38151 RepID=A0A1B6EAU5_9HEMI